MSKDKKQILLAVYWSIDGDDDRYVRRGEITTHIGDEIDPPLSNDEMQHITYAAKMAFAKAMKDRKILKDMGQK